MLQNLSQNQQLSLQIPFPYPIRRGYSSTYRKFQLRSALSVYDHKPARFLIDLSATKHAELDSFIYCAGFELGEWRSSQFAFHLAEWLPDYALIEEELRVNHANMLLKFNQAAIRVYTSEKYKKRGEAGEIALHAVCRDFFQTIPISPRVFYKSASNDLVKAFDMVHAGSLWTGLSSFGWGNRSSGKGRVRDCGCDKVRSQPY